MRYIKARDLFIKEAKIRDVILPRQAIAVKDKWGEKYLDYEEVTPTEKIKQGKWKLSEEDKYEVLGEFTECDMKALLELFKNLPKPFIEIFNKSVDISTIKVNTEIYERILSSFDIQNPSLDQIVVLYDSVFRKLSVADSVADSIISKDENGVPIRDSSNNLIRVAKNVGDIVFSNNLININSFVSDYNSLIDKYVALGLEGYSANDKLSTSKFSEDNLGSFISFAKDNANREYHLDFEIFNRDIYLSISHNPKDILNMSITKFYSSCQHLYTGSHRSQLLGNVFDPNSIPAFLVFDTPIFWNDEKISDQLPLSRMVIRNIDTEDGSLKIFYDRTYPDRMKDVMDRMVTKYSGNEQTFYEDDSLTYVYSPDINPDDSLSTPYHDRLQSTTVQLIGKNTKKLYLSRIHDWSKVKIAPDTNIKEIVIETTEVPDSLFTLNLNLDWIKFRFIDIKKLSNFKIRSNSISFDKCKFDVSILDDINTNNPDIKKLQFVSCDNVGEMDFSIFKNLEELQLLYTLDSIEELQSIFSTNIKKLVISGDLMTKEGKKYINSLKPKGLKIEIVGPVI
jgi:hypothetical protein